MPNILPRSTSGKGVSIQADTLDVSLDAEQIARITGEVIAKAHRDAIPAGQKADGTGDNHDPSGGRDRTVGYESGRLAESITATTTGGETRAQASVGPRGLDQGRMQWLSRNADKVLMAPEPGTPLDAAVEAALSEALDRMIK